MNRPDRPLGKPAPKHVAMSPLRTAILAQTLGGVIAIGLMALFFRDAFPDPLVVATVQAVCAALVSYRLEAPPWWLPIHLTFMPLAIALNGLDLPAGIYLFVFMALLLIFWRTDQSRVPLYLSNASTAAVVATLLPATRCYVVDLGCGSGQLLKRLAGLRPDCRFLGIEHAPLPCLVAKILTFKEKNCRIRLGSFWDQDLAGFDVAYAFLSPVPMPRLWAKACAEMNSSAALISNSFPVPDIAAEQIVDVDDRRSTRLYCYRLPTEKAANPPYSHAIEIDRLHQ